MKKKIRTIVTDIEGTTSSLSFVKDVLFPYSRKYLPAFVQEHQDEVENLLNDVRTEENNPDLTLTEVIEVFLRYIEEDRKITPLKTLQGMIWQAGYEAGDLHGHIYEDALRNLRNWKDSGLDLHVYSSGSVMAQKLLFANTQEGDLTPLFSGYFDTGIGGKKETESYEKIAEKIGRSPAEILFLSDSLDEIKAAAAAGWHVIIVDRDQAQSSNVLGFTVAQNFDDILPDMVRA